LNGRRASSELERAHLDSASVVLYLKQFHTAFLDGDANGRGACIQAVFEQLLEGRRGPVYDLKSGGKQGQLSETVRGTSTEPKETYLARSNTIDDCILQPADWLWL
jgi:hypothetical protein